MMYDVELDEMYDVGKYKYVWMGVWQFKIGKTTGFDHLLGGGGSLFV